VAERLLADWDGALCRFTAVVPRDYKRVLEATRRAEQDGRPVDEAIMEAARG
jgi:glutamate synthase (NADPH/NADH) large chain